MSPERPYLSVVVAARNDDHGGNLLRRMQIFVNGLIEQCRRHEVEAELIFVEWNPLPQCAPLAEALQWPAGNTHCTLRFFEVPPSLHQRFTHWRTLPLYQMIAKNVGIRRARGEFILATNIDILFSEELFQFLAARKLRTDRMYRVDRYDTQAEVPLEAGIEEQLEWAAKHLLRVNGRDGTFALTTEGLRAVGDRDIATPDSGIFLESGWFAAEDGGNHSYRWVENEAEIFLKQGAAPVGTPLVIEAEPGPGTNYEPFQLDVIGKDGERISHHFVKAREEISFDPRIETGGAAKLRLHVMGGGHRLAHDPRILNMRVLRVYWKGQGRNGDVEASEPQDTTGGIAAFAPRTLRPMVARSYRALSWYARSIFRGPKTSTVETKPERDIFEDGVSRWLSERWSAPFILGGNAARWVEDGAQLVMMAPELEAPGLLLELEPGPANAYRPLRVEVRDCWGAVVAQATVTGRVEMRVDLPGLAGAPRVLAFHAPAPENLPQGWSGNQDRLLLIHGARWDTPHAAQEEKAFEFCPLADGGAAAFPGMQTLPARFHKSLDVIVRAPSDGWTHLVLELDAGGAEAGLEVLDVGGHVLTRQIASQGTAVVLPQAMAPNGVYALRLRTESVEDVVLSALRWRESAGAVAMPAPPAVREANPTPLSMEKAAAPVLLHTNACGDFTLLGREAWHDLRGYPEFDAFSMNIDSVFCWAAHHGGYPETILEYPMRIFHIEHAIGSGWTPEGQTKLYQRLMAQGISWIDYQDVLQWARDMNRFGVPMIFNRDDWGFRDEQLKETTIRPEAKRSS